MNKVTIYTDGACKGNPGPGGWGAVLIWMKQPDDKHYYKDIYGGDPYTTNNVMELRACIEALNCLRGECSVTMYTDSKYVKQGITTWIKTWKNNGWLTYHKTPVANKELWAALDKLVMKHKVKVYWTKGHNNNEFNERADALANMGCESVKHLALTTA